MTAPPGYSTERLPGKPSAQMAPSLARRLRIAFRDVLFALRALGIARGDRALLKQALERFEAMDLTWHAEQTRHLQ